MKKLLLTAVLALFSASVFAGTPEGLTVGVGFVHNFYRANPSVDFNRIDNACYIGPYVELGYNAKFLRFSSFYFGARYEFVHANKYGAMYLATTPVYGEFNTYRHYIDIPVKYQFAVNVSRFNKFFVDFGPTFNFLLGNFSNLYEGSYYQYASGRIDWYKDFPDAYNWFNVSLGANVGFQFSESKIFVGYDYGGLMNIYKKSADLYKGSVHQFRIGYAFEF